jgi:hypothetical protein
MIMRLKLERAGEEVVVAYFKSMSRYLAGCTEKLRDTIVR